MGQLDGGKESRKLTFLEAWAELLKRAPSLRPVRLTATTSTGLPVKEERMFLAGWQESEGAGYELADLVGLSDWVLAGGLDWHDRRPPWEYLCWNLFKCLQLAEVWRKEGAKPIRSGASVPGPAAPVQKNRSSVDPEVLAERDASIARARAAAAEEQALRRRSKMQGSAAPASVDEEVHALLERMKAGQFDKAGELAEDASKRVAGGTPRVREAG